MDWLITFSSNRFVNVHAESISDAILQATELMPAETITSARTVHSTYGSFSSQRRFDFVLNRIANYQWMVTRDIDSLTVMAKAATPELFEAVKGLRKANSEIGNAIPEVSLHNFRYTRRSRRHSRSRSRSGDAEN